MVTSSSELLSFRNPLAVPSGSHCSPYHGPRHWTQITSPTCTGSNVLAHAHVCVCVCVCVCVEGSTKNQCTVLSPPSCHPPNAEAGLSLFCCLGTCWPVPSASQLLYSSSQQIFLEGLLGARHCAKCKEGKQSHVKDKPNSNNHTNSFSKCFFLTS